MIRSFIILAGLLLSHSVFAEAVFYHTNTKIADIDCENNTLTLKNMYRTQLPIRSSDKRICNFLSQFSESRGNGKAITLLTVALESSGDRIIQQEVVGGVDVDYMRHSAEDLDPVYHDYCGTVGDNPRSSSKMCLKVSREKLYFVEFTSVQTRQLSKTTVISDVDGKISLESKNAEGKVYLRVTATQKDENTFDAQVSFDGNAPVPATLKRK